MLKNATASGATPSATQEAFSFILRGRNMFSLESAVETGRAPDLTVAQFASRYGQSTAAITDLEDYLNRYGISTSVYPDDLDVTAVGTVGEFDTALSVQQQQYNIPAVAPHGGLTAIPAQLVHGTVDDPYLPASIAPSVLAVLGLTSYAPFSDDLSHTPKGVIGYNAITPTVNLTGNLTPAGFAKDYNLDPLYRSGISGQGQTVGVVTLAGFDPDTAYYFWNNVLDMTPDPNRITVYTVDDGPARPARRPGRPRATWTSSRRRGGPRRQGRRLPGPEHRVRLRGRLLRRGEPEPGWNPVLELGRIRNGPAGVGGAGGEDPAYAEAFDEAFLELAAQGQSTFVAAGNAGAYDALGDLGTTNLSVDNPDDSPFVTSGVAQRWPARSARRSTARSSRRRFPRSAPGAGTGCGRTTPSSASRPRRRSRPPRWAAAAAASAASSRCPDQEMLDRQGAANSGSYSYVQYLTPAANRTVDGLRMPTQWNFDATPVVRHGEGTGRGLPDLATDADPFTGYLIYDPLASPARAGPLPRHRASARRSWTSGGRAIRRSPAGRPTAWACGTRPSTPSRPRPTRRSPRCPPRARATTTSTTPAHPARPSTQARAWATRTWPSWRPTSASGRAGRDVAGRDVTDT